MPDNLFYILILIFGMLGCADRDRENPLDPKNSDTLGKPTGLSVTSRRDTVTLSWNRINLDDLSGFQIYRKSDTEQSFSRFDIAQGVGFVDTKVEFGLTYTYKISAIGDDFESALSDSVCIEPGPTFNWAFGSPDNFNLALFKFTHDYKHEIHNTFGFLRPKDLEIDSRNGQAWVLDEVSFVLGQLIRVTSVGEVVTPIINLNIPRDIEIERSTGYVWVSDVGDSTVKKFDDTGGEIFSIGGFFKPVALAVDQRQGDCWVADLGKNQVVKINSNGQGLLVSPAAFEGLSWLAVDSNSGSVWVATDNQLIKLKEDGTPELTVRQTFNFLKKVEVNQGNGDVWVIGWEPFSVYKFTRDGSLAFEKSGFGGPVDLSINEFDNSCVVADTLTNQVIEISANGETVTTVQELIFPIAIAVQNEL